MTFFFVISESDYFISGDDIYRLYAGKINNVNVPLDMIEDYSRSFPSLKFDWKYFDELMREETRKSKMYSIYDKTIKTNQNISQHPTDRIFDLLKRHTSLKKTVDDPYKYQSDKSFHAKIELIIQMDTNNQLSVVESINKYFKYYILLDRTNFYATSGGQSSDHGTIQFPDNLIFRIE